MRLCILSILLFASTAFATTPAAHEVDDAASMTSSMPVEDIVPDTCPAGYPIDCGNGYCCDSGHPYCCPNATCSTSSSCSTGTTCPTGYPISCGDGYCCDNAHPYCCGNGTCSTTSSCSGGTGGGGGGTGGGGGGGTCPTGEFPCGTGCAPQGDVCCTPVGVNGYCLVGQSCTTDGHCLSTDGTQTGTSGSTGASPFDGAKSLCSTNSAPAGLLPLVIGMLLALRGKKRSQP